MRVRLCGLFLATAIAGCVLSPSRDAATPDEVSVYFPLTMGSWWNYKVEDFAKGWKYEQKVIVTSRGIVRGLDSDTAVVEEMYSSEEEPFFETSVEPMAYLWKEGYLQRIFLTRRNQELVPVEGFSERRILPRALVPGMTWTAPGVSFRLGRQVGFRVRHHHYITVEEDAVQVPGGAFTHCIRVDTISHHGVPTRDPRSEIVFYYSDWYAPGVGLVRSELWDDRARTRERVRLELVNFEIVDRPRTKYRLAEKPFVPASLAPSTLRLDSFWKGALSPADPPA